MSGQDDCWDNAAMEQAYGTLKVECVDDAHFATREQARQGIVEFIGYCNTESRHSSLGNIAPAEFERCWRAGVILDEERAAPSKHRVTHRRPVPGSSHATEPAVRGKRSSWLRGVHQTGAGSGKISRHWCVAAFKAGPYAGHDLRTNPGTGFV